MSKVIHLGPSEKQRQVIAEKACWWVVKLSEAPSAAELRELHEWLKQNPAHVEALLDAATMWDRVSVLSELSEIFPLEQYLAPRTATKKRLLVAAAALLVLCLLLQGPFLGWPENSGREWSNAPLSYETEVGEQITLTLPDGSNVILNTDSRIEVAFDAASRDIHLRRGEAHFTVATDPDRPFRVHARAGVVEAVGTAFTVQDIVRQGLEVTVLEGKVNVTPTRPAAVQGVEAPAAGAAPAPVLTAVEPIALSAGESVEIDEEDVAVRKLRMPPNELESRLAWRHGMLLFLGDPLDSVVREVSRYTSIRIDVDENVRDIRVLGYFRTGDIEGILLTMQDTFHIKVERLSDQHIVLRPDGWE